MVLRRKNLLDALRQAQRPEAAAPPPVTPARPVEPARPAQVQRPADAPRGVDPRAASGANTANASSGSLASSAARETTSTASNDASRTQETSTRSVAGEVRLPPTSHAAQRDGSPARPLLLGALALAVGVLAFVLWRKGGTDGSDGVSAAPGASDAAATPGADLQTPRYGYTRHDEAFLDKKNRFTVQVATYDNDEKGLAAARGAYAYLDDEGVPAIQPIRSGDGRHLFLCVGYDAEKSALAPMQKHVAKLRGPKATKKLPFEGAYVISIDDVVRR